MIQGMYDKGQPMYEQCYEMSKIVLGENHPDTLASMHTLSELYGNQGMYDTAQPLLEQW